MRGNTSMACGQTGPVPTFAERWARPCAEHAPLGGTCVNVGCVPKKLMTYGAHFLHDVHDAQAYGWDVPQAPQLQWSRFIDNKVAPHGDRVLSTLPRATPLNRTAC